MPRPATKGSRPCRRNIAIRTADCAALVLAGAFFGGTEADRWLRSAHADLEREIAVQILEDGVDFEASAAYHRLVSELFLLAAIHAAHRGLPISAL